MSVRANIQTKHVIEYDTGRFGNANAQLAIYEWLTDNDVTPIGAGECGEECNWCIDKNELRDIGEGAYEDLTVKKGYTIAADELREFVKDLLAAPTGEYAYVDWF